MTLRFLVLTLFGFLLFSASSTSYASAAENCDFGKNIAEIQALKGQASPEAEEKELALRKETLSSILECLSFSTDKIYEKVFASPFISSAGNLRMRLLYELEGTSFFYKEKVKEVESADMEQSKLMAKEVLGWKRNHDENLERSLQYVLWAENQALLIATEKRLSQLNKLLLKSSNPKLLDESHSLVFSAKEYNLRAKETMERSEPPTETWKFIKSSLESMQKAYESFLKVTTAPHPWLTQQPHVPQLKNPA